MNVCCQKTHAKRNRHLQCGRDKLPAQDHALIDRPGRKSSASCRDICCRKPGIGEVTKSLRGDSARSLLPCLDVLIIEKQGARASHAEADPSHEEHPWQSFQGETLPHDT